MPTKITYAIGDIHGCYTMLNNLLKNCMQHCGEHEFHVVFLGDYVDRGKRSREVVELLMRTQTYAPQHGLLAQWPVARAIRQAIS